MQEETKHDVAQNETAGVNKKLILEGLEAIWNQHDWSASERYYAADITVYAPTQPEPLRGRDAVEEMFRMLHTAFPDIHFVVEDAISEGDKVALRWTHAGTHLGDFMGFPPTGRRFDVSEVSLFRVEDGKVKEMWPMPNVLGQMSQLGLIPDGPPPKILMWLMRLKQRRA